MVNFGVLITFTMKKKKVRMIIKTLDNYHRKFLMHGTVCMVKFTSTFNLKTNT